MNIKRILCPIDFSEFNQAANEYASMLAKSTGARIIYLHSYLPDILYESPEVYVAPKDEQKILEKMEQEFAPTVDDIESSYVIELGSPADQIIQYAKKNEVDMIVIGTHGRTGLRRIILGSVAESVVRRADCPVLAIKTDSRMLEKAPRDPVERRRK